MTSDEAVRELQKLRDYLEKRMRTPKSKQDYDNSKRMALAVGTILTERTEMQQRISELVRES